MQHTIIQEMSSHSNLSDETNNSAARQAKYYMHSSGDETRLSRGNELVTRRSLGESLMKGPARAFRATMWGVK